MRRWVVLVSLCLILAGCSSGGVLAQRVASASNEAPLRLTMIGASSFYGAAESGATPPKPVNSVVGLIRAKADAAYGPAGSGLVVPTAATLANPSYDPRFTITGTVKPASAGFFGGAAWSLAKDASVSFRDSATSFRVWTLSTASADLDGGTPTSLADGLNTVAAGTPGTHLLTIHGPATLLGIEAATGTGRVVVDAVAENGRSAQQFQQPGSLAMLDTLKPGVAVISLGANDWISGTPVDDYTGYLTTIVNRVTAAGGIPVLHVQPIPSKALTASGGPSWEQYRAAVVALGAKLHCQVIDQAYLWGQDFTAGKAKGKYADAIHPSDAGAHDIADGIWKALNG